MQLVFKILRYVLWSLSPFICSFSLHYIYQRFVKKLKPIKGSYKPLGHGSKLKRIFWDFPKRLVIDRLTFDPDTFREFGVHMVAGEQGSGKTVTVAYMLQRFQKMYPKIKVKSNFCYKYQDGEINHWKDVVASENGIYGEVNVLDEVQNWFNSLQSKDFPPEMMTEITQQRKQRKIILGTSQVFTRVAKPIREQTHLLYLPITLFGCFTIVRRYKPVIKADSGQPDEKKLRGIFFFVHDEKLRDSFDTYHKIEKMSSEGFKPTSEHVRDDNPTVVYI